MPYFKRMKNAILFLITFGLLLISESSNAQYKKYRPKSRKTEGLADYIRPFNFTGWYVAPGVTLTPKLNFFSYDPVTEVEDAPNNFEALNLTQKSKLGLYLEVGRYKLLSSKKLISYIDYGLAYKQLKGTQTYDLDITSGLSRDTVSHEQDFSMHNATLHFNANNVIGINKNFFIQNTLGINADYSFIRKLNTSDQSAYTSTYQDAPARIGADIHYKFGLGFRVSERFYLIPSVETPILSAWKFENGRSTIGAFNSRYRPIIISLRIAWLTKPSCPKTWDSQDSKNNGGAPDVW